MRGNTYETLRAEVEAMPLVDAHEHHVARARTSDILQFISGFYLRHDLASAVGSEAAERIFDASLPLEERWRIFEPAYRASRHTGYGRGVRYGMEYVFGSDEVTLDSLREWSARIPDYSDPDQYERPFADAKIRARVTDNWPPLSKIVDGSYRGLPNQHLAISLPQSHAITRRTDIEKIERAVGVRVTSLDEYVDMCRLIFGKWSECGAVCFKDQSAYQRRIDYRLATKTDAEALFNRLLADPRQAIEWGESGHALSDYLMHCFLRIAREMDLPVQYHTGHMAHNYNDVAKGNAAHLRVVLEVHRDVRFDLFHANWPYGGDLLFLVKNYPNVRINFCWAQQIDPVYAHRLLVQSVSAVPYTKVHAFGSDVGGDQPHLSWAYAKLARDSVASALAELVDTDFIDLDAAREIAIAWLYNNPREYFRLPIDAA